jgi:hypothetical protein
MGTSPGNRKVHWSLQKKPTLRWTVAHPGRLPCNWKLLLSLHKYTNRHYHHIHLKVYNIAPVSLRSR